MNVIKVENKLLLFLPQSGPQEPKPELEARFLYFFLDVFERKGEQRARQDGGSKSGAGRQESTLTLY